MKLKNRAIRIIKESRGSHVQWLEWQEANADWRDRVTSESPGGPEHHREWIAMYDVVLRALGRLP